MSYYGREIRYGTPPGWWGRNGGVLVGCLLVLIILGGCSGGCYAVKTGNQSDVTLHVKDKERTGGDSGKYLVFTREGVFQDTDNWFLGKTDSSDVYNELERGKAYRCRVQGWRFSLVSWYRNIIRCEPAR